MILGIEFSEQIWTKRDRDREIRDSTDHSEGNKQTGATVFRATFMLSGNILQNWVQKEEGV